MFQKFADKKRIKQAVGFYFKKHQECPNLSENDICRLLLKNWIYHSSPIKGMDEIDTYIKEIFKREITIFDACYCGITSEFHNKYQFNKQKNKNLDKHAAILDDLKNRINKELKKYELK